MKENALEQDTTYQEYKLARDSMQLLNARVIRCDAERGITGKIAASDIGVGLQVKKKHQWKDETTAEGYLLADIRFGSKADKNAFILKAQIEIQGVFKMKEAMGSKEELDKRLALQIVPQLLPYARGAAMTIAALMGVPTPYELIPTMDILKSIRENRNHD